MPLVSKHLPFWQYFLSGILLADIYVSGEAGKLFNRTYMIPVALLCLGCICYLPLGDSFYGALTIPFLISLLYYIILKNAVIKKIFSYKFIPIIGGMCYSIYLLHYTIVSVLGRFPTLTLSFTRFYLPNLLLQIRAVINTYPGVVVCFLLLCRATFYVAQMAGYAPKKR